MKKPKGTLIYDLDKTLCAKKKPHETYADVQPIQPMIDQLNRFHDEGFEIIISTARNMVTQKNHVSKVVKNVGMDTMMWLKKHNVKYDGLDWGKEYGILYIDDKSCLADVDEIERRVSSIKEGKEEEYIENHLNLKKECELLKQKVKDLELELEKYK